MRHDPHRPHLALPGRTIDLMRDGDPSEFGGDRSRARFSITMTYIACGRTAADLIADLADPANAAGELWKIKMRRIGRTEKTRPTARKHWEAFVREEWKRALKRYSPRSVLPTNAVEALRYLVEVQEALDATPFPFRTDTTDRAILNALIAKAKELGRIDLTMALSQVEMAARLGTSAVRAGLKRLIAAGWLRRTTSSTAVRGAGYALCIPQVRAVSETLDQLDVVHGDGDVLEVLSPGARKLYAVIDTQQVRSTEELIAQPSTQGRSRIYDLLRELRVAGLVRSAVGGWIRDARGLAAAKAEGADLAGERADAITRRRALWERFRAVRKIADDWMPSSVERAARDARTSRSRAAEIRRVWAANAEASERAHRVRMAQAIPLGA